MAAEFIHDGGKFDAKGFRLQEQFSVPFLQEQYSVPHLQVQYSVPHLQEQYSVPHLQEQFSVPFLQNQYFRDYTGGLGKNLQNQYSWLQNQYSKVGLPNMVVAPTVVAMAPYLVRKDTNPC